MFYCAGLAMSDEKELLYIEQLCICCLEKL